MRKIPLILMLLFLVISCEDASDPISKNTKKQAVSTTNLTQEPGLQYALDYAGFVGSGSSARSNSDGVALNVDEIIKVLKADSVKGVYTMLVEDEETNSLTNFIVEELEVGYSAFYQEFSWEGNEQPNFQSFTGRVTRTDLEGNIIMDINQ